jgi:hypothetical protein
MFLYTWQRIISEMLEKVLPPFVYKWHGKAEWQLRFYVPYIVF